MAIGFLSQQLGLAASGRLDFAMKGSNNEKARTQIRSYLDFHPVTVADTEQLQYYLPEHAVPQDQEACHLRSAALDCAGRAK